MDDDGPGGTRILGRLEAVDGRGVVRMTDRYDTDVDDLWSALTERDRLGQWLATVDGDLRVGGELQVHFFASGWDGTARVEVCERSRRLRVLTTEAGAADGHVMTATLGVHGEGSTLVLEQRGVPLDQLAAYGAGLQIHVEDLDAHLDGRGRCDARARFEQLHPAYVTLAAAVRAGDATRPTVP